MPRASDSVRALVVQAVVDLYRCTGHPPTVSELGNKLGWPQEHENRRQRLVPCTSKGELKVTNTLPRRVQVTVAGAQLLKGTVAA